MNETLNTLFTRRSIRSYDASRPVPEQALHTILEAGAYAPSGRGTQSWRMVALASPEMVERYRALCMKTLGVFPYYDAPIIAMVFVDKAVTAPVMDGSAALENMLLAAAALGIGSCWIHATSRVFATAEGAAFQRELGVPEQYACIDGCALGYAQSEPPEPAPRASGVVIIR